MKLTISAVNNGYILEYPSDLQEGVTETEVFEVEGDNTAVAVQHLLYAIIEAVGAAGSRYDKERVYVEVRPGDKYEGGPQDSPIGTFNGNLQD